MEDHPKDEVQFDRYAFASSPAPPEKPAGGRYVGLVVVMLLVALGGFGFYLARERGWFSGRAEPRPVVSALEQQLEEIEERLARLETRRRSAPAPAEDRSPVAAPAGAGELPAAEGPAPRAAAKAVTPPGPATEPPAGSSQVPASGVDPAWQATASRLGQTVGEVGEQRRQIRENRLVLEQLLASQDRTQHPFRLERRNGQMRVGPVMMELRRADRRRQTYTLRLLVDDRPVEVRDRVALERVEFFTADSARPIELIVHSVSDNTVEGVLLVARGEVSLRP